jgi:hypothetical protein
VNAPHPPRMILVAAGASVPAGIPTATGMVEILCKWIKERDPRGWSLFGGVIDSVVGALKWHRASVRRDPFGPVDIEDLYEMLCALRDRHKLPITPFVGSWSHAVSGISQASIDALISETTEAFTIDMRDLTSSLESIHRISGRMGDVGVRLERFDAALRGLIGAVGGQDITIFDQAIKAVLRAVENICRIKDEASIGYLRPLLRNAKSRNLWIATLNYDRSMEIAAEVEGVACDLGIQGNGAVIEFGNGGPLCLAKLHGSVDWSMDAEWSISVGQHSRGNTALIFGAGNKLRVEGPYLDLLLAFREQLGRSSQLEVCGYSFRDAHINHLLLRWLIQDDTRKIQIFDPQLTAERVEENMNQALGRDRTLKRSWLARRLDIRQIGVIDWASNTKSSVTS